MTIFHHGSLLTIALLACACRVSTLAVPLAPPGVHVRPEVARGYLAYEAPLAAFGDWAPDRDFGVHWCPSRSATGGPDVGFQPYVDRGHWEASEAATAHAPAGSPVWRSEDSDTWGKITSHHGWWIPVAGRGDAPWCWVPGLEETPGRVVWREGDGFVGWAPELPFWVAVDEVDYDDGLDWVYTLLGTLFDGSSGDNVLTGNAREKARAATAPGRAADGSFQHQRVGPSGASVGAARQVLSEYVLKHPDAIAAAAAQGNSHPSGSSGSRSKSSSSGVKKSEGKDGVSVTASAAPAPFAQTYYDAFQMEPPGSPAGVASHGGTSGQAVAAGREAGGSGGEGATGEGRSENLHGEGKARQAAASRTASAPASGHAYSSSSTSSGRSSKSRSGRSGKSRR